MTQCCNDYGECEHGPGCPAGAVTVAPRTCEALGICQHPERECPGACEQIPRVPGVLHCDMVQPTEPLDSFPLNLTDLAQVALICLTAGCVAAALFSVWPPYFLVSI